VRQSTRLKVAYFIDSMNIAGTEIQLTATIDNLDRDRVDAFLFCLRAAENPIDPMPECARFMLDVPTFKAPSAWLKVARVGSWLRRNRIDVIQTYFADASLFGVYAARLARRPLIVVCRRDMGYWLAPEEISRLRGLNRYADHFIANAECIKATLVREENIPGDHITVLPNGIDLGCFDNTAQDSRSETRRLLGLKGDYAVGMVANLNRPIKRVDVFIQAAALVVQKMPLTDFVIIGDGYLKPDLIHLSDDLGIGERVHFLGLRKDVPRCLSCFDVAVNSSDSEGLCNARIEYMAAGLASVVTDTGGNGELVDGGTCGRLVPTNDHVAMASAVAYYLDDDNARHEAGRRARKRAESLYDQRVTVKQQMDFYERICRCRK